jgi:hypothetical protein
MTQRFLQRAYVLAVALCICAAPAMAQTAVPAPYTVKPYQLTAADAAAINARRPTDWIPYHVSAGDIFRINSMGAILIPTIAPATDGSEVAFEDLEPIATVTK